jgi:hypothetical protein
MADAAQATRMLLLGILQIMHRRDYELAEMA